MAEQTVTRITGVVTVGVQLADQEHGLDFYTQLGFEKRRDLPFGPGLRWIEVAPPGAVTTVALTPKPDAAAGPVDTGIRLATPDADATHAHLHEAGVDVDDVMRFGAGVPPMFSLRDPEGNTLYIVETA